MPWNEPKTWNTGDLLTAQDMNEQLRDNMRYLAGLPYAQSTVRQSANYSTSSKVFVDIDASALSLTLTTAGVVELGFLGTVSLDRSGYIVLEMTVDGASVSGGPGLARLSVAHANQPQSIAFTLLRDRLTAGQREFRMQWRVSTGTGKLYAAAGKNDYPAFFWARSLT